MKETIAILRRHWKALSLLNVVIASMAVASAILSPRVWEADAQLVLPDSTNGLNASLGTLGNIEQKETQFTNELSPIKVQASIIMSQIIMQRTLNADPQKSLFPRLDSFRKLFKVKPEEQSTIIQISVKGSSEAVAKQRAENLLSFYQLRLNELRIGADTNRQRFVSKQLENAQMGLLQARLNLAKFQKQTGLVNSEEQTKSLVLTIDSLTNSHAIALAQYNASASEVNSLVQRIGLSPNQAFSTLKLSENKEFQEIRQKLSTVETDLAFQRGTHTENSPEVVSLLAQRDELNQALQRTFKAVAPEAPTTAQTFGGNPSSGNNVNQAAIVVQLLETESKAKGAKRQVDQLQQYIDNLKNRLSNFSTLQARLNELQEKQDIAEGIYKGVVAQIQQDKISAFNYYPNVQVLDLPTVDSKPISPKLSFIVLGALLASIFLSLALAIHLESRDPRLKPKDVQDIEYPVLAKMPQMELLSPELGLDVDTEAEFQRLASAISLMPFENRRLMVTSSIAAEGKTSIVLGLALALTDLGFHVLLVDGDYRRASLSQRLGIHTHDYKGPIPVRRRLDLLPTNATETSAKIMEHVAQGSFEEALTAYEQSGRYDYILVDSAPLGLNSEASLMAAAVRQVLFVVRMGVSHRDQMQSTFEQLKRCNAQVLGLVLNGLDTRSEAYPYKAEKVKIS
ncbi:MAG TPA: GNVR domain-containing protein [Stenomitos sp.]